MNQDNYQTEELLEESIRAANRTTRAVRSIAILILYMVPFETIAGLIYGGAFLAANSDPANNWQMLAYGAAIAILVLVGGLIFTIVAAYRELLKSKVVAGPNSRVFEAREVAQNISFSSEPRKD